MSDVQQKLTEAERKHNQRARCLDPDWEYVPAAATDVTKTWRKFGWVPLDEQRTKESKQ